MSREAKPASVVMVLHPDDVWPGVHGPYTPEVAEVQAGRIREALRRSHLLGTYSPNDYRVWVTPIMRGPVRVKGYTG